MKRLVGYLLEGIFKLFLILLEKFRYDMVYLYIKDVYILFGWKILMWFKFLLFEFNFNIIIGLWRKLNDCGIL